MFNWLNKNLPEGIRDDEPIMQFNVSHLRYYGLWKVNSTSYRIYKLLLIRLFTVFTASQGVQLGLSEHLATSASVVDTFTICFSILVRLVYFDLNFDRFQALIHKIEKVFVRYPLVGPKESFSLFLYTRYAKKCCIFNFGTAILTALFFIIAPLLKGGYSFPFEIWLPAGILFTPAYEILFVIQSINALYVALIYIASDNILFMIIYLFCGQMDIFIISLKEIIDNKTVYTFKDVNDLKRCMKHHCECLSIMEELDKFYRTMVSVDMIHAILSATFGLVHLLDLYKTNGGIASVIKMCIFLTVCFTHVFLNSFFGEMLLSKQEELTRQLYELDWHLMPPSLAKNIQIAITRSMKPVTISAWKVANYCFETFMEMMKSLGSYFMVLLEVYEGK